MFSYVFLSRFYLKVSVFQDNDVSCTASDFGCSCKIGSFPFLFLTPNKSLGVQAWAVPWFSETSVWGELIVQVIVSWQQSVMLMLVQEQMELGVELWLIPAHYAEITNPQRIIRKAAVSPPGTNHGRRCGVGTLDKSHQSPLVTDVGVEESRRGSRRVQTCFRNSDL